MKFDIITLFPKMFEGPFSESIILRAQDKGLLEIDIHNLRDFASDKHKTVDDTPYGGGAGMVLKVAVVDDSLQHVISSNPNIKNKDARDPNAKGILCYSQNDKNKLKIILLTPTGQIFNQQKAIELSKYDNVILIAGHYEGFDQRIHEHLVDEELSVGEYVLTGGELPAMVVVDAVTRMIPGVIKEESMMNESFMVDRKPKIENRRSKKTVNGQRSTVFDFPVYTKPPEYKGWKVPEVLLSGNHAEIEEWRKQHQCRNNADLSH